MSQDQIRWYEGIIVGIDLLVRSEVQEIADREIRQDVDSLLVAARNILNRELESLRTGE